MSLACASVRLYTPTGGARLGRRMAAGDETSGKATAQFGWRTGLKVFRSILQTQEDERDELPSDFRPPAGEEMVGRARKARRSVRHTAARQEVLAAVVKVFDEDDDESVAAWSWLDVRADESDVERVAVLVGAHLIGFLPLDESKALEGTARDGVKKRKVAWVDTFIERAAGSFVADVNLP